MPWPDESLLIVRSLESKGRGVFAARKIEPGDPILCEDAIVTAPLGDQPELQKKAQRRAASWLIAAQFATVLLAQGAECVKRTDFLCPSLSELEEVPMEEEEEATVASLVQVFPIASNQARRLLHVVNRNSFAFDGMQALFERASMINHGCMPNATQQAFRRTADGALCICIRAVTSIAPDAEILISYADDLAAPPSERSVWLSHHGFAPEVRPGIDDALEEWLVAPSSEKRKQVEPMIGALNVAADKAWQEAEAAGTRCARAKREAIREAAGRAATARAADEAVAAAAEAAVNAAPEVAAAHPDTGNTPDDTASLTAGGAADEAAERTHYMTAAAHYAKLLQVGSGVLGPRHALLLQARARLAQVMTLSKAQRSCANALPLWRAVLSQTRQCVPPNWPQLLTPLRGARDAAKYAGDEAASNEFAEELGRMLGVLSTKCADVEDGAEAPRIVELSVDLAKVAIS
jgi:hypothetical protein